MLSCDLFRPTRGNGRRSGWHHAPIRRLAIRRRALATLTALLLTAGTAHSRSIDGSTVDPISPPQICAETRYVFAFLVQNLSPDEEWLAHIEITFPEGFVIHPETASYEEGFSGPWSFDFSVTGTDVQTAIWHDGDGEEGEIWAGDSGTFRVEATAPTGLIGDLFFPWHLEGDIYAEPPHMVDGVFEIPLCSTATEPTTWGAVKVVYR